MRKLLARLGCAFLITLTIAGTVTVFGVEYLPNKINITWKFAVYAYPYFEAKPIAAFPPQYVNVIKHDKGDGWILISTYFGDAWTNIIRPLYGRTVILDAGHGLGSDNVFMGYSEQATMLRLALKIQPLLEEQGATVFLTRETYANVTLPVRAAKINLLALDALHQQALDDEIKEIDALIAIMQRIVNNYSKYAPTYFNFPFDWSFQRQIHPDLQRIFELQANPEIQRNFLMISLHSNAARAPVNPEINGADVYRMTNDLVNSRNYFANYTSVEETYLFANILLDKIQELGINRREVKPGNWFVIREHNLPGILIENGFHTNPSDRALLSSDYFLQSLAAAYRDAIMRYFKYIEQKTEAVLSTANPDYKHR